MSHIKKFYFKLETTLQSANSFNALKRTDAEPIINDAFKQDVQKLTKAVDEISHLTTNVAESILTFAGDFKMLRDTCRNHKQDKRVYEDYLANALSMTTFIKKTANPTDRAVWSKWYKIGEHAYAMLEHADSVPINREALYRVALLLDRDDLNLEQLIACGLTTDSTVREIDELAFVIEHGDGKDRAHPKTKTHTYEMDLGLYFRTEKQAVEALLALHNANADFKMRIRKSTFAALQSELKDDFSDILERIKRRG